MVFQLQKQSIYVQLFLPYACCCKNVLDNYRTIVHSYLTREHPLRVIYGQVRQCTPILTTSIMSSCFVMSWFDKVRHHCNEISSPIEDNCSWSSFHSVNTFCFLCFVYTRMYINTVFISWLYQSYIYIYKLYAYISRPTLLKHLKCLNNIKLQY